jgi:hypothetical protein
MRCDSDRDEVKTNHPPPPLLPSDSAAAAAALDAVAAACTIPWLPVPASVHRVLDFAAPLSELLTFSFFQHIHYQEFFTHVPMIDVFQYSTVA